MKEKKTKIAVADWGFSLACNYVYCYLRISWVVSVSESNVVCVALCSVVISQNVRQTQVGHMTQWLSHHLGYLYPMTEYVSLTPSSILESLFLLTCTLGKQGCWLKWLCPCCNMGDLDWVLTPGLELAQPRPNDIMGIWGAKKYRRSPSRSVTVFQNWN